MTAALANFSNWFYYLVAFFNLHKRRKKTEKLRPDYKTGGVDFFRPGFVSGKKNTQQPPTRK
mgnify:CR=1 FL=1